MRNTVHVIHISKTTEWGDRRLYARPFGLVIPRIDMFDRWADEKRSRLDHTHMEWCRNTIGYAPPIKYLSHDGVLMACAMFHNTTDIDLFYLAFAEKWQQTDENILPNIRRMMP